MSIVPQPTDLFPLVYRDCCTQPDCNCKGTAFQVGVFCFKHNTYFKIFQIVPVRREPTHGSEVCGCRHYYWQHYLTKAAFHHVSNVSNSLSRARGHCIETGCGGFIPEVWLNLVPLLKIMVLTRI